MEYNKRISAIAPGVLGLTGIETAEPLRPATRWRATIY